MEPAASGIPCALEIWGIIFPAIALIGSQWQQDWQGSICEVE